MKPLPLRVLLCVAVLATVAVSSCATSNIGGEVSYVSGRAAELHESNLRGYCAGACLEIAPDGTCVRHASGMSATCSGYFQGIAHIKARSDEQRMATDLQRYREGHEILSQFINTVCAPTDNRGYRSVVEVNGDLNAGLAPLVRKLLGLGFAAAGSAKFERHKGVRPDDQLQENISTRECNQQVWDDLKGMIVKPDRG